MEDVVRVAWMLLVWRKGGEGSTVEMCVRLMGRSGSV